MSFNAQNIKDLFIKFFGLGLIKFAPGTWGALAGYLLNFAFIMLYVQIAGINIYFWFFYIPLLVFIFFYASSLIDDYQKRTKTEDSSEIVIDEVLGSMIAFTAASLILMAIQSIDYFSSRGYLMLATTLHYNILLFILFRVFDVFKLGPIKRIDRDMKNGFGVMLDDVLAGVAAGVVTNIIYVIIYFFK